MILSTLYCSKQTGAERCTEMIRLMFHLDESDVTSYDQHTRFSRNQVDDDVKSLMEFSTIKKIKEQMSSDNAAGLAVFLDVGDMEDGLCALLVSDQLDPQREIRNLIVRVPGIVELADDTEITIGFRDCDKYVRDREVSILKLFLDEQVDGRYSLVEHPTDPLLCHTTDDEDYKFDCSQQIKEYFICQKQFQCLSHHIIFLGPVNSRVVHYKEFVLLYVASLTKQLLTGQSDLYFIINTTQLCGVGTLADILPTGLPDHAQMDVFAAYDPVVQSVSCLVLKISFNTGRLF